MATHRKRASVRVSPSRQARLDTHTNTQYVCHPQALPADGRWPRHPAARRAVHLVQAAAAAVGAATGAAQPTSDGAAVARKEAPSGAHACRGVEPVRAGKVGGELPAPEGRSMEGAGDDTLSLNVQCMTGPCTHPPVPPTINLGALGCKLHLQGRGGGDDTGHGHKEPRPSSHLLLQQAAVPARAGCSMQPKVRCPALLACIHQKRLDGASHHVQGHIEEVVVHVRLWVDERGGQGTAQGQ